MIVKRSLSIQGHRTSISIEDAFWDELRRIALRDRISLSKLVARIDANRSETTNLSSSLRLFVLSEALAGRERDESFRHENRPADVAD